MGLLDKASRSFSRSIDETVRVVDYDALPEDDEAPKRTPKQKTPREPKPPKPPREKKRMGFGAAAKSLLSEKKEPEAQEDEIEELPVEIPEPQPEPHKRFEPIDTAFEIDEDEPSFYEEKQALWDSKKPDPLTEQLVPDNGAIQDVLDVLKIPATFVINPDVLMPEDFAEIDFDIQVPQGYDVGQVQFFMEKVEASVKEYLHLLEQRNEHIATLATTVDRLQVDANNLKYDNQIAAGIGIMPTSDSVDLENENMELKLQIQKMKDAAKTTLNSDERELYEELRNEFGRLEREKQDLEEKVYELNTVIAQMEEDADEMDTSPADTLAHEAAEIVFESMDDEPLPGFSNGFSTPSSDELPSLGDDESLPEIDFSNSGRMTSISNSSFDVDDDFESLSEDEVVTPASSEFFDDEDDDDELDQLMRDWKN